MQQGVLVVVEMVSGRMDSCSFVVVEERRNGNGPWIDASSVLEIGDEMAILNGDQMIWMWIFDWYDAVGIWIERTMECRGDGIDAVLQIVFVVEVQVIVVCDLDWLIAFCGTLIDGDDWVIECDVFVILEQMEIFYVLTIDVWYFASVLVIGVAVVLVIVYSWV